MAKVIVAVALPASAPVAVIVTLTVPTVVGVPVNAPVLELNVKPAGVLDAAKVTAPVKLVGV
jgi:hypothetical protein